VTTVPALAAQILAGLFSTSPYENLDHRAYPRDLQGSPIDPIMRQAFDAVRPRVIVEVGSWKGASACYWGSLLRESNIDGVVICVDTWLGSREHLGVAASAHAPEWDLNRYRKHGYPTLYYQFLANVMHEGLQDYIVPLPNTSVIAARWLAAHKLSAQLIFIDASHEEEDVDVDLRAYWPLLRPGGIMCGDDFSEAWPGVVNAVQRFASANKLNLQTHGVCWAMQK
jgi:predicted O-methyltransferase YrrM